MTWPFEYFTGYLLTIDPGDESPESFPELPSRQQFDPSASSSQGHSPLPGFLSSQGGTGFGTGVTPLELLDDELLDDELLDDELLDEELLDDELLDEELLDEELLDEELLDDELLDEELLLGAALLLEGKLVDDELAGGGPILELLKGGNQPELEDDKLELEDEEELELDDDGLDDELENEDDELGYHADELEGKGVFEELLIGFSVNIFSR